MRSPEKPSSTLIVASPDVRQARSRVNRMKIAAEGSEPDEPPDHAQCNGFTAQKAETGQMLAQLARDESPTRSAS